jgi:hypothetical protein
VREGSRRERSIETGTLIPEQATTHEEHGYEVRLNSPPFTVAAYEIRFVGH